LLSEVVLSDRTPRQLRPWLVQRSVTRSTASAGIPRHGGKRVGGDRARDARNCPKV
jgi:hypothetical protein